MARSELLLAALLCGGCDLAVGMSEDTHPCGTQTFHGQPTTVVEAAAFSIDWDAARRADRPRRRPDERVQPRHETTGGDRPRRLRRHRALAVPRRRWPVLHRDDRAADADGRRAAEVYLADRSARTARHVRGHAECRCVRPASRARPFARHPARRAGIRGSVRHLGRGRRSARCPRLCRAEPHAERPDDGLRGDLGDTPGIFQATRATTSQAFSAPQLVLAGTHLFPQLLGRCSNLYVVDDDGTRTLMRYDR